MKNLLFGVLILMSSISFAQFTIKAKISNYAQQPVMVRINLGTESKLINRVETDNNGAFSVKIPQKYSGIVNLTNLQRSSSIEILTDNEDVEFTADYSPAAVFENVLITKGKTAMAFQQYRSYEKFNDVKQNIFPIIKTAYTKDDAFYKAMIQEEERISKLNPATDFPLLKYYAQVSDLANAQVDNKTTGEIYMNKILSRLTHDNEYLEGSGFLAPLVLNYFRYSIMGATSQDDINKTIDNEIGKLLDATDIETPRGQNVLSAIFTVLPVEQFGPIIEKYYSKANALTCEITDQLKSTLSAHNMVAGSVVPNIKFKEAVKGFKSIYDVKADKKIIIFWASWCPACRDEMPFVKEYYPTFKKEGGEIIAISLDYDLNEFNEATKDFGWINYTELAQWDTSGIVEYGVSSTPTLFLVDKDNKLIKKASHISELIDLK